jgi:NTE family protein
VDGGIVCNFPVWIYDDDIEAGNPPVGFCLVDDGETRPIHGVVSMFAAILETMLEARDKRYIADEKLSTVQIPTLGIQTCDFHLSRDRQEALYLAGRKAAVKYLDVMARGAGSRAALSDSQAENCNASPSPGDCIVFSVNREEQPSGKGNHQNRHLDS